MPLVSTFGSLSARALGLGGYRASGAFSPSSLFAASEQGVWYDPSDLTTMFESYSGGTGYLTRVHVPGNGSADSPVGVILDKHQAQGAELLTNGNFSNGTTGWSIYQQSGTGTLTVSGGVATLTNSSSASYGTAYQSITTTIGNWYLVSGIIVSSTGTTFNALRKSYNSPPTLALVEIYNVNGAVPNNTSVLGCFKAVDTTSYISIQVNDANKSISFTNISVKEIPGNHATQSTSTARPTLSARYNLLTYSEQFDNAAWTKSGATITANQTTAPDNTNTADLLVESATNAIHYATQSATVSASSIQYQLSAYFKSSTRTCGVLQLTNGTIRYTAVFDLSSGFATATQTASSPTGTSNSTVNVGNGWFLCTITCNLTTTATGIVAVSNSSSPSTWSSALPQYTGDGTSGIYIWGADLRVSNDGVGLPAYQRIADGNTYDSTGFPYYIKFDGVDDCLFTSSIDFTGTNKISVFAGARKFTSSGAGFLFELSSNSETTNGSFGLGPNVATTNDWCFLSRGTSLVYPYSSAVAPITKIITATSDISTPSAILRFNGSQVDSKSGSQGTGNYGNYPIYIGRRGNVEKPFNGRTYGLIIRGASSTSTEIANTETWLNNITKAY